MTQSLAIACTADRHLSVPDFKSLSLFPRQVNILGSHEGPRFYHRMVDAIDQANNFVNTLLTQLDLDALIDIGDIFTGWQERGCFHPSVYPLMDEMKEKATLITKVYLPLPGNHDLGYSGSNKGYLMRESLEAWIEKMDSPFWAVPLGGMLHVGICSPFIQEHSDSYFQKWKNEQENFLLSALEGNENPWILYLHDLSSVAHLQHIISPHLQRLEHVVFADAHDPAAEWYGKALARLHGVSPKIIARATLCPSVAPLWWRGHGYLDIVKMDRTLHIQQHAPDPPAFADQDLPSASRVKCLMWMALPRAVR